MAEKKNQHYVPQAYLRFFSNDEKNVGVYTIATQTKILSAPIKGQASKDYFYSHDLRLENELDEIEGQGMESFRKIIDNYGYQWNKWDYINAYVFIMIQQGRTPVAAEKQDNFSSDLMMQMFKIYMGQKDIDPHLKFKCACAPAFSVCINSLCMTECLDLKYRIIHIQDNLTERFISSDNPVCMFNPFFENLGIKNATALGNKGLCILMTITPELAIILYDSEVYKIGSRNTWLDITENADVEMINKIVAYNSKSVLYFNNKYRINESVENFSIHKLMKTDYYFPTIRNGRCILSFIKLLDKAKYYRKTDFISTPELRFRNFTNYLNRHPEIRERLDKSWGSASKEDRRKFTEEMNSKSQN